MKMFEHMENQPAILFNGFRAAGIYWHYGSSRNENKPVDPNTLSTSDHFDSFTESEDDPCSDLDCSGSSKDVLSVDSGFQDSNSEEAEQNSPIML